MAKRKWKNIILKIIGYADGIAFILSLCIVDNKSFVPLFVCLGTATFFYFFAKANDWFRESEYDL